MTNARGQLLAACTMMLVEKLPDNQQFTSFCLDTDRQFWLVLRLSTIEESPLAKFKLGIYLKVMEAHD
jgi:hypothetical protein